jgi:hypothetical protein
MAAEQSAASSVTEVSATAEKEPVAAKSSAAAATDPVGWEFRLTADRRRILVPVSRTGASKSS